MQHVRGTAMGRTGRSCSTHEEQTCIRERFGKVKCILLKRESGKVSKTTIQRRHYLQNMSAIQQQQQRRTFPTRFPMTANKMIPMQTVQLPADIWEQILLTYFHDLISTTHTHLVSTVHQHLTTIRLICADMNDICTSSYFLRSIFEWTFPRLSTSLVPSMEVSLADMHDLESKVPILAWNTTTRSNLKELQLARYPFLWQIMTRLFRSEWKGHNSSSGGGGSGSASFPPDDIVVWESMNGDTSWCLRFISNTKVLCFSSRNEWVVFWRRVNASSGNEMMMMTRGESGGGGGVEEEEDTVSMSWRPPKRYYVFEDVVTISSHLKALHYVDQDGKKAEMEYQQCGVCYQRYPVCGKTRRRRSMCGSCLYVMDMDIFAHY